MVLGVVGATPKNPKVLGAIVAWILVYVMNALTFAKCSSQTLSSNLAVLIHVPRRSGCFKHSLLPTYLSVIRTSTQNSLSTELSELNAGLYRELLVHDGTREELNLHPLPRSIGELNPSFKRDKLA